MIGAGAGISVSRRQRRDIVRDTFTRADSAVTLGNTELGGAWVVSSGTWGVASGKAYSVDGVAGNRVQIDSLRVDARLSVLMTTTDWTVRQPQVVFRLSATTVWLGFSITDAGLVLVKRDGGGFTTLATGTFTPVNGTTYRLDVEYSGNTIMAWIDGVYIVAYALTGGDITSFNQAGATTIGMRLNGSGTDAANATRWDDLTVGGWA